MRHLKFALITFAALILCGGALAEPVYHILKKGETVYSISRDYGVKPEDILKANGVADARKLLVGAKLLIPSFHLVAKGETLYGIARVYDIELEALLKANGLKTGALIKPGDRLLVPGAQAAPGSIALPLKPLPGAGAETALGGAKPPEGSGKSASGTATPAPSGAWPAKGSQRYLNGKLFGLAIDATLASPIVAVRSGTVVSAGPFRGFGRVAFVQSQDGLIYVYGGASELEVAVGDAIVPGSSIGAVGVDLVEKKPVAYFLVFKDGEAMDPRTAPREAAY